MVRLATLSWAQQGSKLWHDDYQHRADTVPHHNSRPHLSYCVSFGSAATKPISECRVGRSLASLSLGGSASSATKTRRTRKLTDDAHSHNFTLSAKRQPLSTSLVRSYRQPYATRQARRVEKPHLIVRSVKRRLNPAHQPTQDCFQSHLPQTRQYG